MSLFRSSFIVGSLTMLSRVFGFLRDVLIANILGVTIYTDAFFVAFKLPNLLRRLFAEGAFNSAFLPMFAGMLKTDGKDAALEFASRVATILGIILTIIILICIAFMPYVIMGIAPGFAPESELFNLTVDVSRITFPYLFFISLVCLLAGVLNSIEKFAAVAAAPILMNIAIILCLVFLKDVASTGAHALAIGVLFAGLFQFVWLVISCQRNGMLPTVKKPTLTPNIRKLLRLIAPAAIGAGVIQINMLVDMIIASKLDKAVSYLYYADRLYELPLGVIGIAVATALLPTLSKQMRSGDTAAAIKSTNQSIMLVMLLGLPATAALLTIADPIIRVVFEHGAFSAADRAATAPALIAYAAGLPSFLFIKIFAANFFASQDTKTPVKIAVVCLLINLCLNLILMRYIAHVGLAVATSVAGWSNAIMLGAVLYRRGAFVPDRKLIIFIVKCVVSCIVMGVALLLMTPPLSDMLAQGIFKQSLALATLICVGATLYFIMTFFTGMISMRELKRLLKRGG